jgi:proteasome lid subunit RPN8/RPN11
MVLCLSKDQARAIIDHAKRETPREVCGIIGGLRGKTATIIPVPNIARNPNTHYELDHRALAASLFALKNEGLSIIGFYHSHPGGDPIPSEADIHEATYPDVAYLILGMRNIEPCFAAWKITDGRVEPVQLVIGIHEINLNADSSLSQTQQWAIVIAAVVAFALVLIIAFKLLPPAPPYPVP